MGWGGGLFGWGGVLTPTSNGGVCMILGGVGGGGGGGIGVLPRVEGGGEGAKGGRGGVVLFRVFACCPKRYA